MSLEHAITVRDVLEAMFAVVFATMLTGLALWLVSKFKE